MPWEGRLCPSEVSGNSSEGQVVPHHLGGHSSWWEQLELNLLAKWGGHQPAGGSGSDAIGKEGQLKAGDWGWGHARPGDGTCSSQPGQDVVTAATRLEDPGRGRGPWEGQGAQVAHHRN